MIALCKLQGQDPLYSQFYNTPVALNPAFAGNSNAPILVGSVRIQMPGLNLPYNTYAFTYDQYFERLNSGFGAVILNDDAGDGALSNTKISGIYSYKIDAGNGNFIRGGLNVSAIQTRLNWDKFIFYDALDLRFGGISPGGVKYPSLEIPPDRNSNMSLSLGAGILYYNERYYAGISVDNLNSPGKGFISGSDGPIIPTLLTIHGGAQFNLDISNKSGTQSFITPNVLFARQGNFSQVNVGAYAEINQILGGVWYRMSEINTDAVIFSAGVRTGMFKISYSFDFTLSKISIRGGGAHELGIQVNLERLYPVESRYEDCFQIFR